MANIPQIAVGSDQNSATASCSWQVWTAITLSREAPGRAARGQVGAQGVAVVRAVGEQDLAVAEAVQHVDGALSIMGLAFGQLQRNGQAVGVDERMNLGRQSASRAPHASA